MASDGRIMDRLPPLAGLVLDGDDAALAAYQGTADGDLLYQSDTAALTGQWRGFGARDDPGAAGLPERFRPRRPLIEVGFSTTKAPPPSGFPDVVAWVACAPATNLSGVACVERPGAFEALLQRCANETAEVLAGQAPSCANETNATCAAAVAEYRGTCEYQRLSSADVNRTLVDRLYAECVRRAPCDLFGENGTLTVTDLELGRSAVPGHPRGRAWGRGRGALDGMGPQRRPQRRLGRRLEEVAKSGWGRLLSVTNAVEAGTWR